MVRPIVLVGLLAAATIAVVMVGPATLKSVVDDPAPVDELPEPAVLLPNTDPPPAVDDQPADVADAVVSSGSSPTSGGVPLPLVGVTLAAGLGALIMFAYLFVEEGGLTMTAQIVFWIGWFVVVVVLWSILYAIYLKG